MDAKFDALHQRVRNIGLSHCERIKKLNQVQPNLHRRVCDAWNRNSLHAAEIINECLVQNVRWGSGFRYDDESGDALLITTTTLPFSEFKGILLQKYASDTSYGVAYTGLLHDLLSDPSIVRLPFGHFFHWIFSAGNHGLWVNCCIGNRNQDTTRFSFIVPADAVFSENEIAAFVYVQEVKDLIRNSHGARDFVSKANQAGFQSIKQDSMGLWLEKGDFTLIVDVRRSHGPDSIWSLSMALRGLDLVNLVCEGKTTF